MQTVRSLHDIEVHPDGRTALLMLEEGVSAGDFAVVDLDQPGEVRTATLADPAALR